MRNVKGPGTSIEKVAGMTKSANQQLPGIGTGDQVLYIRTLNPKNVKDFLLGKYRFSEKDFALLGRNDVVVVITRRDPSDDRPQPGIENDTVHDLNQKGYLIHCMYRVTEMQTRQELRLRQKKDGTYEVLPEIQTEEDLLRESNANPDPLGLFKKQDVKKIRKMDPKIMNKIRQRRLKWKKEGSRKKKKRRRRKKK